MLVTGDNWGGPGPDKELAGCNQSNQVCLTRVKQVALI